MHSRRLDGGGCNPAHPLNAEECVHRADQGLMALGRNQVSMGSQHCKEVRRTS